MSEFLRALGYDPTRYWLLAWSCFALWTVTWFRGRDAVGGDAPSKPPGFPARLTSPCCYTLLLLAAMVAFRWPAICFYKPVNPDEPQFLAGALTMLARHEFWWPDQLTSGPLMVLPLTIPGLFGWPIDYATGRAMGLLLSWGVAVFTYLTLRHVHGDRLARWLNLPLACFVVLLNFWDFTAYCSEWLPLFLCSAAVWLCLTAFGADGRVATRWRLAAAGGVVGIMPVSKLQSVPLGAAIGIAAIALVLAQPGSDRRRVVRDLAALLGATAGILLAVVAWAWLAGDAPYFFTSYVLQNVNYAQERAVPWSDSIAEVRYLAEFSWGFTSFLYGQLLVLAAGLLALRRLPRVAWNNILFGWFLLFASYYVVNAPGRAYPHYLLFLTVPLALAAGLPFGHLLRQVTARPAARIGFLVLLLGAGAGAQIAERMFVSRPMLKLVPDTHSRAQIVDLLDHLKRPGDTLAVWGWRPELFVETQLPQGVRDANSERQLKDYPRRDFFRARFLSDLKTSRPAFFVDAVGPGGFIFTDRTTSGLETFTALNDYVVGNYRPLGEVDTFRVYLRRDRAPTTSR